jgi:hypothetical protein
MNEATVRDAPFDLRMDLRLDEMMAEGSKRALKDRQPVSRESLTEWLLDELREWANRPEQKGPESVALTPEQKRRIQDWAERTSLAHQRVMAQLATNTPPPSPSPKEAETLSHVSKTLHAEIGSVGRSVDRMGSDLRGLIERAAIAEILALKGEVARLKEGQPDFRAEFDRLHGGAAGVVHELIELRKMIVDLSAGIEARGGRFDPGQGAHAATEGHAPAPEARGKPAQGSKKDRH